MTEIWRVGHRVPLNVYEGDRPVCQCHTPEDAQLIVDAVNVRDTAVSLAVIAETQRREDVVAELGRQTGSLERQRDMAQAEAERLRALVEELEHEALVERRRAQGSGLCS